MKEQSQIGPALGKIASGLYVATGRLPGGPTGMLASFVEQAGFDPPTISIALGMERPLARVLEAGGTFGLHILSKQNGPLVKTFTRPDAADAFSLHPTVPNEWDVPQFAEAWAFLACRATGSVEAGDHRLFVARVLGGVLQHAGQEAMIRIRQNGFAY